MKTLFKAVLICGLTVFLTSSCSSVSGERGSEVQAPVVPLSCIVVLPANTSVDNDGTINYDKAQSLEKGARYADGVIQTKLTGNSKVRLLSKVQLGKLVPAIEGGFSGTVVSIGKKMNCDAVLVTVVSRFKQRVGSELASDSPASAEFKMVLRHSEKGAVLWSADFRETQDSFLSNIFSYNKVQSRGLKWISVEQLMEQGINQRLEECPYL